MSQTSNVRLLVVGDTRGLAGRCATVLRSAGFEIWEARTGGEALGSARQHRPDIVLLEGCLPDATGIEVCGQIKNDPNLSGVPVALLAVGECQSAPSGPDDYIPEKIAAEELLARVRLLARLRAAMAFVRAREQPHDGLARVMTDAAGLVNEPRRPSAFAGPAGDPTRRNAGHDLLRESEERFRQLAEHIGEVFWITDPAKTKVFYISPAYERIWGRTRESLYQSPWSWVESIHPEERERVLAAARDWQASGGYDESYRILRPDGALRWIRDRAFPVRNEVGEVYRIVGIAEDITALKQSELHLALLAQAVQGTNQPICITDMADRFTFVNHAFERTYGYTRAEILGQTPAILASPRNPPGLLAEILSGTRAGGWQGEVLDVRKDGQEIPIYLTTSLIRDHAGVVVGLMGVAQDITDRKQAERVLRDSEERFRQAMEAAGFIAWQIDIPTGVITYSDNIRALVGGDDIKRYCSVNEVLQEMHPDDRDPTARKLAAALTGKEPFEMQYRVRMLDGSYRWIQGKGRALHDPEGQPRRALGISLDITERKEAEAILRASESRFRTLFESAPIAMGLHDTSSHYVQTNRVYQQMLGYTGDELRRLGPAKVTHPEDVPYSRRLFEELCAGKHDQYTHEKRYLRKDGETVWANSSASAVRNDRGELSFIISMVEDITDRKRAEERIRLLADALQSAQEIVSVTDHQNRFTFVNAAFLKAYGYSEAEVLGQTPEFLYSPQNPGGLYHQVYEGTLAGGWRGEIINRRKDGTEFPISLTTSEIKTREGKTLGLLGIARDISERIRNERLQRALAALGHRLSAATVPASAAQIILEVALDLLGWDAGYVHLYSEADDRIIWLQTMDTIQGRRVPVPVPSPKPSALMRRVMKEGARIVKRGDVSSIPRELERFGDLGRPSAVMMYAPIRSGGRAIGILSIQSYARGAYSESDVPLLQALGDYCGDALLRIRVRETLEETEAKYRGIFENATEGIFRSTTEGRLLDANPALARMFGYTSPEALMAEVTDIASQLYVLPQRRAELRKSLEKSASVRDFEVEHRRKDGSRIWVRVNARAVRDPAKGTVCYEGTVNDITESKRAQEALENTRRLQQTILENIPDPAWLKDAEGRFLACNRALAKFYDRAPESLLGRTAFDVASDEAARLTDEDNQVMKSRKSAVFEQLRTDGHGKHRWFEAVKAPVFDERGQVQGTVGVARDMTERKRIEEELHRLPRRIIEAQEAERQRVARDLHDSVNQILASAQMRLRRVEGSGAEFRPSTREILARCHDLLVQALEENRRIAHDLRPSDLDELGLAVACRNFCQQFQTRTNLAVTARLGHLGVRLAPAAELSLYRIVQEAFNNVEKHASARRIRLHLSARGEFLLLRIQDDGCGFDPNAPRARKARRTGLGLTNIRERATTLGGVCEVASAPGKGTIITVRIPLLPGAET